MVDFVYDRNKNTLTGHGKVWNVRSGIPGRYSPTPVGDYNIPKGALMAGGVGHGVPYDSKYSQAPFSYRDNKGLSWFLWIGVDNLGIHPDGNIPGTKGCIGITDSDTRPLFDKIKKLNARVISLQVK